VPQGELDPLELQVIQDQQEEPVQQEEREELDPLEIQVVQEIQEV
jgi:hypothetical protein